jgi:hypothetical protein
MAAFVRRSAPAGPSFHVIWRMEASRSISQRTPRTEANDTASSSPPLTAIRKSGSIWEVAAGPDRRAPRWNVTDPDRSKPTRRCLPSTT